MNQPATPPRYKAYYEPTCHSAALRGLLRTNLPLRRATRLTTNQPATPPRYEAYYEPTCRFQLSTFNLRPSTFNLILQIADGDAALAVTGGFAKGTQKTP